MSDTDLYITAIVASLSLLVLTAMLFLVLTASANRRQRHRAELAELRLHRDAELRRAEREAVGHTLTEVGRELHDNVGQLLTVAQVGLLDHLAQEVRAHPRVATALEALDQALEEVRRLGRSLNNDHLRQLPLAQMLELEATRLERLRRARVLLEIDPAVPDPPPDTKVILFRVFQEAVTNALRHSGARTLTISLSGAPPTLRVQDDGRGFHPDRHGDGNGLRNIRARCRLIGYAAALTTEPGKGCTWTFTPLPGHEAPGRLGG